MVNALDVENLCAPTVIVTDRTIVVASSDVSITAGIYSSASLPGPGAWLTPILTRRESFFRRRMPAPKSIRDMKGKGARETDVLGNFGAPTVVIANWAVVVASSEVCEAACINASASLPSS